MVSYSLLHLSLSQSEISECVEGESSLFPPHFPVSIGDSVETTWKWNGDLERSFRNTLYLDILQRLTRMVLDLQ